MASNADHFVLFTGSVHLRTSLGVLLDVNERRIFLRYSETSTSPLRFVPGETVTLDVRRSFAEAEGVIESRS